MFFTHVLCLYGFAGRIIVVIGKPEGQLMVTYKGMGIIAFFLI